MSVTTEDSTCSDDDYVDIGQLDFDKLRQAFQKSNNKNIVVFDLQEAIERKLEKMVQQNPLRLEFYERYKKIIEDYNQGKVHIPAQLEHLFWLNVNKYSG